MFSAWKIAKMALTNNVKGLKRERRDAKKSKEHSEEAEGQPWVNNKVIVDNMSV
jgi:hypothetical protein